MPIARRLAPALLLVAVLAACGGTEQARSQPTAPTSVYATAQSGAIVITWTDTSAHEDGFRVRRERVTEVATTQDNAELIAEVGANVTRYEDHTVSTEHTYRYFVSAFNAAGESTRVRQLSPDVSPVPTVLTLNVTRSGNGSGSVASSPAGIDCGADCSAQFAEGSNVFLTAAPEPGSSFVSWSGDCSGKSLTCSVEMDDNRLVTAQFAKLPDAPSGKETLLVALSGSGTGSIVSAPAGIDCGEACIAHFDASTAVTLTASPGPGSTFAGWQGDCSGSGSTCQVTMSESHAVTATFEQVPVDLSVTVQGPGSVKSSPAGIDCGDDCSTAFVQGTEVTLTATPRSTAEFLGWDGDCGGSDHVCEVSLTVDRTVTARFADTDIVVDSTAGTKGGSECTLRAAIEAANTDAAVGGCRAGNGADIIRLPAESTFSLQFLDNGTDGGNGLPTITSRITIQGNGSTVERGDSAARFRVFHVAAGGHLTVEDLTVRNGDGGDFGGGGFYVAGGRLELVSSVVTENHTARTKSGLGAGILSFGGNVSLQSSEVSKNVNNFYSDMFSEATGTGITSVDGILKIRDSTITRNNSGSTAGILLRGATSFAEIEDSWIENNDGRGLENEGELWLTNVTLSRNALGQGIAGMTSSGIAFLDNVTYTYNSAEAGGSLRNSGEMEIKDSLIKSNSAGEYGTGGGITNYGTMRILNTVITENEGAGSTETGGGIDNSGELHIIDSSIVGNVSNEGGGVWNDGRLILEDSVVDDNWVLADGGGILNLGEVILRGSTVIGGTYGNRARFGGGISAGLQWEDAEDISVVMEGASSIANNEATRDGGGIYAYAPLSLSICDSCRIYGNRAGSGNGGSGTGGGVYGTEITFPTLNAQQIFNNSPDDLAPGGTLKVRVRHGQDDAEEFRQATAEPALPAGSVYFESQDLEFTYDPDSDLDSDQYVGIRFTDLQIPRGATIVGAYIQFTTDEVGSGATDVRIFLQDSVDPEEFVRANASFDISTRPRTTANGVVWTPGPWTLVNEAGPAQRTSDLTSLVQPMIDDQDWDPGKSMAFIFAGAEEQQRGATRTAFAYDRDATKAPQLVIHYFDP